MRKALLASLLVTMLAVVPAVSRAATFAGGEKTTVASETIVDGDYYAQGETVSIHGTINGDLIVAGGTVDLDGTVTGDVLAAGGTLLISGVVHDDVRAAGGQVLIKGSVDGDVVVAGGQVRIEEAATIGQDLLVAGSQVTLLGTVSGDVRAAGESTRLAGAVRGDVRVDGRDIDIDSTAQITGDLIYTSQDKITVPANAVAGTVTFNEIEREWLARANLGVALAGALFSGAAIAALVLYELAALVTLVVLAGLLAKFYPVFVLRVRRELSRERGATLAWGLLVGIGGPLVLVALALSIIGLPLAFAGGLALGIASYLTTIFLGAKLGERILRNFARPEGYALTTQVMLGSVIVQILFAALYFVPVVGSVLVGLAKFWALGALVRALVHRHKQAVAHAQH